MSVLVRLCGSVPNCEPWSPFACVHADGLCSSGIVALENSPPTPAASSPPPTGSHPSYVHTAYTPSPSHRHICITLHPHIHVATPRALYPHVQVCTPTTYTPTLRNQVVTHTYHISVHPHIHTCQGSDHTHTTGSTHLDLPVTPISHLTLAPLSHTHHSRHLPSCTYTHMPMCVRAHTHPHQLSDSPFTPPNPPANSLGRLRLAERAPRLPTLPVGRRERAPHPHPEQ